MKRLFHPGDEWVYIRLYTGPETGDDWLARILPDLLNEMENHKLIDSCFFIRYYDPQFQLRVRFHLVEDCYLSQVVELIRKYSEYYFSNELIWKSELGSYERELERYSSEWIECAEEIFWYDTVYWLELLPRLRDDINGEEKRWKLAFYDVHTLFEDFNLGIEDRISMLSRMSDSLFNEMGRSRKMKLMIDEKLRENREVLEKILSNSAELGIENLEGITEVRSGKFRKIDRDNNPFISKDLNRRNNLISDLIHMSLNRGLRSRHRLHEMLIYSFLKQLYVSSVARRK